MSDDAAVAAVDEVVTRGGEADDVLREVVAIVHDRIEGVTFAGIAFVEGDELLLGPSAGESAAERESFPIAFRGSHVANLEVAGPGVRDSTRATLVRVADIISPYCLVGWDTGGEDWEP